MSRAPRWSEADIRRLTEGFDDEQKRRFNGMGTLDNDGLSLPRALQGASRLELELLGHLTVMRLEPEQQYRFHPERKWRLDFAFPAVLVGVEIDGGIFGAENGEEAGKHVRGAGRLKDMEKRNAAAELGWLILNYGPPQIRSGEAALQIERLVRARESSVAAGVSFALVRERDGIAV